MNNSEFGVGLAQMGIMVKVSALLGVGMGGNRRTGNYGTSANSSSHAESSWHLREFTEGVVTIGVGSLFQYFTTRVEKDDFLRRRPQNFERMTSQARLHERNKK